MKRQKPKTKLEILKDELLLYKVALASHVKIAEAKADDKTGAWQKIFEERRSFNHNYLRSLDSNSETFKSSYDRAQAILDEYDLLLGLLANPEDKVRSIEKEMKALSEKIETLEKGGETKGQF